MLYPPMDVTIETTDGRVLVGCEEYVKGDPRNPFTLADCVERFMAWAAVAARPLPRADLERFVAMVERLEDVKDAATLMPLLGGAGATSEERRR